MVVVSAQIIAWSYCLGAALLALWLFSRYPRFGPNTLRSAILMVGAAQLSLLMTGKATTAAEDALGRAAALVAVFLPLLVFPFWAALRLIHATNNHFKA